MPLCAHIILGPTCLVCSLELPVKYGEGHFDANGGRRTSGVFVYYSVYWVKL